MLLLAVAAMAQKKMTINLIKSDKTVASKQNGVDIFRVYNGVFQQKYSTLRADSSIIYPQSNTFDAFGHVVIIQGDTLHVYSDKLNYNDNTKIAILTDNVKLVDKDAILTTNNLNYNTATKYGTYVNGGKLVNKDNTLVSQNGYYFAQSRDAYFRYNVVMTGTDVLIKTDTLRYNSGSRITYFYGPTHIYGKKDKDTLYTENGTYNTKTEQAFFGKRNRYSQGTKSLKGDSLFYDKLKGYGKAIKNITFEDTEQKTTIKGNLGEYYKKDDKAVITQDPYVIFVTEEKDTTKHNTAAKLPLPTKKDSTAKVTLPKGAIPLTKDNKLINAATPKNLNAAKADSLTKSIAAMPAVKNAMPLVSKLQDTIKKSIPVSPPTTKQANSNAKGTAPPKNSKPVAKNDKSGISDSLSAAKKIAAAVKDTSHLKRDTMYIGADTLETQIVTYKAFKDLEEQRRIAGIVDTTRKLRKPFVPYKTIPKVLELDPPKPIFPEPDFKGRPLFVAVKKAPAPADTTVKKKTVKQPEAKSDVKRVALTDTLKAKHKADSLAKLKPVLSDTSRIRILSAHHNVRIFKSDLQSRSDSLFYSSSDSIIRSFVKPIYWTQGAQLTGDTIYMQLKNKKLDNLDVYPNAFLVYIEKNDSTHFNQMAGKRLQGYFKDSKLSRAVVTGNAQTVYYNRKKGKVTEMQHSLSSAITIHMKNGEAASLAFTSNPDHKVYPIAKVKEDDKILKGFVWRPKERPQSKEDVIHPKKMVPEKPATDKKTVNGKLPTKSAGKDSVKTPVPALKTTPGAGKDSTVLKKDSTVAKPDTTQKHQPATFKKNLGNKKL